MAGEHDAARRIAEGSRRCLWCRRSVARCVAIHDDEVRGVRRIVEGNEVEGREARRAVGECALQTHGVEWTGPEISRDVNRVRLGARLQYHRYRISQNRKLGKYRRQLRDLGLE